MKILSATLKSFVTTFHKSIYFHLVDFDFHIKETVIDNRKAEICSQNHITGSKLLIFIHLVEIFCKCFSILCKFESKKLINDEFIALRKSLFFIQLLIFSI